MPTTICRRAATRAELEGHFAVRRRVFVDEQKLFTGSDRDAHDEHAIHLVAIDVATGEVVGAVRCYRDSVGSSGLRACGSTWYGGRLAVLPEYRKSAEAIGSALCRLAIATMEEKTVTRFLALVQLRNVRFFQRMGWMRLGRPTSHCGQDHQLMRAPLYRRQAPPVAHSPSRELEDASGIAGYAR